MLILNIIMSHNYDFCVCEGSSDVLYRHLYHMETGGRVHDFQAVDLHHVPIPSVAVLSLQLQLPSQLSHMESLFEKSCAERQMHLSL